MDEAGDHDVLDGWRACRYGPAYIYLPSSSRILPSSASATLAIHFRIGFYSLVWQVCPSLIP